MLGEGSNQYMTPSEFIARVVTAYQNARVPQYVDEKVSRGRSHAVSSIVEDLFAYYLIANSSSINKIYVDQPISLSIKKRIYPDIVVVKDNMIVAFIDLKMDIGWNRSGLYDLCKKHSDIIEAIRGTECSLRDGSTKETRHYTISDDLTYSIVIVSSTNISPIKLEEQLKLSRVLEPSVEVVVLCKKGRPNTYGTNPDEVIKTLDIDYGAFDKILKKVGK